MRAETAGDCILRPGKYDQLRGHVPLLEARIPPLPGWWRRCSGSKQRRDFYHGQAETKEDFGATMADPKPGGQLSFTACRFKSRSTRWNEGQMPMTFYRLLTKITQDTPEENVLALLKSLMPQPPLWWMGKTWTQSPRWGIGFPADRMKFYVEAGWERSSDHRRCEGAISSGERSVLLVSSTRLSSRPWRSQSGPAPFSWSFYSGRWTKGGNPRGDLMISQLELGCVDRDDHWDDYPRS